MASAEEARARGNAAFSAGNFTDAVKHYTEAITLSPSNHLLYCDRSAAYASLDDHTSALSDAQRAVQLNSSWPACHWRLGAAYQGLHNYSTAISTYQNGLRLAPGNEALKYGLAKATLDSSSAAFGGLFSGLQQRMQNHSNLPHQQLMKNQFNMQHPPPLNHVNMLQQPQRLQQQQNMQQIIPPPQLQQLLQQSLQNQLNIQQRLQQQQQRLQQRLLRLQLIMQQQQQQQRRLQMLIGQQFTGNAIYGDGKANQCGSIELSPTTNSQIIGIGSSATVLSADLAADASMSTGVMSLRSSSATKKQKRAAADAFDLLGDLAKLTEQPSNIWTKELERHTNMANSLDIASEAVAMQWQGLEASPGAHGALKWAREILEKAGLLNKKEKEANDTLAQKNLEPEESASTLQTRVKELENELSKMSEDHAQLNKELKEAASYFGWKARIEMMEEFVVGKHVAWNPSEERALFLEAYPPIQIKEKDSPVTEADQPAQDVDKETVEVEEVEEDEETFQIVQRNLEAFVL